jgi:hypothetical protein
METKLNSRDKKILIVGAISLIAIIFFFTQIGRQLKPKETTIIINGQKILAESAATPEQHYQGLSGRTKLCENCGMLFIFSDKQVQDFYMRNMNFPLDIVFIADNKILKISPNLLPEGANPQAIYSSELPINYVLELNSGYTDKYNINVGDEVEFNF